MNSTLEICSFPDGKSAMHALLTTARWIIWKSPHPNLRSADGAEPFTSIRNPTTAHVPAASTGTASANCTGADTKSAITR